MAAFRIVTKKEDIDFKNFKTSTLFYWRLSNNTIVPTKPSDAFVRIKIYAMQNENILFIEQ